MRFLSFGFFLLLSGSVMAASFDCAKARTGVEKAICGNPQLSKLDSAMYSEYQGLLERASNPQFVRATQRDWLVLVRNVCQSTVCLQSAYEHRIKVLRGGAPEDLGADAVTTNAFSLSMPITAATAYGPAATNLASVANWMAQTRFLEKVRALADSYTKLPVGFRLTAQQCGKPNAFYFAGTNAAVICYELADLLVGEHKARIAAGESAQTEAARYFSGLEFIALHEIGHALLHDMARKESFLGREETAADAFAYAALIGRVSTQADIDSLLWGIQSFYTTVGKGGAEDLTDEHELPLQRWANFVCLMGGKFPGMLPQLVAQKHLSQRRGSLCEGEWQRTWNGFITLTRRGI